MPTLKRFAIAVAMQVLALGMPATLGGCAAQQRADAVNTTNVILRAARRVCSWIQAVPELPVPADAGAPTSGGAQ